jgi:cytidyltransferase-like protein
MKIVLVTGGFDPLHSGHIAYFKAAKTLGDFLIVGINSDAWLTRKKGRAFMPWQERAAVVGNINVVYQVIDYDDSDGSSIDAIRRVREEYPKAEIIFANGGDRTPNNIPEMAFEDNNVTFAFGVGGEEKRNSSSWILEEWKAPKTERSWGYYRILHTVGAGVKLKELTVQPKTCLSMQRHENRAEFWFVAEGSAKVYTLDSSSDHDLLHELEYQQHCFIPRSAWHMLCNESDQPLKLIEIQYGENCVEEDIQRR